METKLYHIKTLFARENSVPVMFIANEIRSTERAVYLKGRGTLQSKRYNICCICGRELTHPVSVLLGIGPECGRHYWDWDRVGGYTEANLEKLKPLIQNVTVERWFPKGVILEVLPSSEQLEFESEPTKVEVQKLVEMSEYYNKEQCLKITFPYSKIDIDNVKTLLGRRFNAQNPSNKFWTCELTKENLESLRSWGFTLDAECLNFLKMEEDLIEKMKEAGKLPIKKELNLYPFQNDGVNFLRSKDGRGIIADEMGLGKTVQALAYLAYNQKRPAIIIVPASLKLNWERETKKWLPSSIITILSGKKPDKNVLNQADIIIVNYDILEAWLERLIEIKPQIIITDEAHYYKSRTAKRTKAVKTLAKGVPHFIALSGTPILNRPIEIYNAVKIVKPSLFPNFMHFANRYCGAKHNGYGWDFNGATNTQELHQILTSNVMIRRLKKDVLQDLPNKIRSFVPMELDNMKEYQHAKEDLIQWIRMNRGASAAMKASEAEVLVRIETLKQLAVKGKMLKVLEWVVDFLESGQKLVIFATHKVVIDQLMELFAGIAVKIDGSVSQDNRQLAVDQFQNNPSCRLFVGNIRAAGVGLTLTAASNVAFIELPWTPGELSQAEDRCHRIGQKDAVNIHYLLAANTIEEEIAELIDNKMRILDAVLDGKQTESSSLLSELMNKYQ